ncbi:MAG: hypothetical protein JWR16_2725 [Nevskia sp.]|nr:hypothetical protein [Nevskia sp.]
MTEYEAPIRAPRRRWPGRVLMSLLVLIVLVALVAGSLRGWQLWHRHADAEDIIAAQDTLLRRLSHQVADQQADLEQQRERTADLADSQHQLADGLAAEQSRSADSEHALAQLGAAVQGGRTRAQLIAVEQLLLIANDRVQLEHDSQTAATALQLAQDRLATLAEPKLFQIRKAIADERTALLAVPHADRATTALALASLIDRAPTLPLRARPPVQPLPGSTLLAEPAPIGAGFWARGWASVRKVLGALFVVRRTDQPVQPLLPADQEALVVDLFDLKLEAARTALLRNQTAAFRSALESAQKLLDENYRVEDPAIAAARDQLEAMKKLELDPPLPDVSRSLGLLRAYLDAMPR